MTKIIPYDKDIVRTKGSLIDVNGEIIPVTTTHEDLAEDYCNGKYHKIIKSIIDGRSYYCSHFDEFQKLYGYAGTIEELSEFATSELTKRELHLYELWIQACLKEKIGTPLDFMISVLDFDKAEKMFTNSIKTSCYNPHVRYFNFYIMDWDINPVYPMRYNEKTGLFEYYQNLYYDSEEKYAEEEINVIKKDVPIEERPLFFR